MSACGTYISLNPGFRRAKPKIRAACARVEHGTALRLAQGIKGVRGVTQSKAARRGWTGAWSLLIAVVLAAVTSAAVAFGLERLALWRVVQICVANYKLT